MIGELFGNLERERTGQYYYWQNVLHQQHWTMQGADSVVVVVSL